MLSPASTRNVPYPRLLRLHAPVDPNRRIFSDRTTLPILASICGRSSRNGAGLIAVGVPRSLPTGQIGKNDPVHHPFNRGVIVCEDGALLARCLRIHDAGCGQFPHCKCNELFRQ